MKNLKPRLLATLGAILVLTVYFALAWWLMTPPPKASSRIPEWTPEEKAMVIKKMKYHGISGCIQDENGYYFYNSKGQRCKL